MHHASTQTPATHLPYAETQPIVGGETAVTLTSAATLGSLGVGVAPLGSATLDASGADPVATFPITGGTVGPGSDAVVLHQGSGLELSATSAWVDLSDFLIDTRNAVVNANVAVNGEDAGNAAVFGIGADGATLTLTSFAAEVLGEVFGTGAITPGLEIGVAAPSPILYEPATPPGPPDDDVDWNALAAQVQANFAATGQWFL
jgi:hypothetical protein